MSAPGLWALFFLELPYILHRKLSSIFGINQVVLCMSGELVEFLIY